MKEKFVPGRWFLLKYGSKRSLFYCINSNDEIVIFNSPAWLVNDFLIFTYDEIAARGEQIFLDVTKKKWYLNFIPFPFRNYVCPYYFPNEFRVYG